MINVAYILIYKSNLISQTAILLPKLKESDQVSMKMCGIQDTAVSYRMGTKTL